MMPFSIGIGLECVGIVGPELELLLGQFDGSGRLTPLQKQETKRIGGGSPVASPMLKPVTDERKNQLLRGRMFYVPFTDGVTWYL